MAATAHSKTGEPVTPRGSWRCRLRRLLGFFLCGAAVPAAFAFVEIARLPDLETLRQNALASTVLLDREGAALRYALTPDGRLAPPIELCGTPDGTTSGVHPRMVEATIAAEDERFYEHLGVDPVAVLRAAASNLSAGRIVSGASTITMQVARMLRPLPRGFYGKFREAVLALYIETRMSKEEILQLYFQLSPYGGNVHGVDAAARRYFGRSAGDLSLSEATLIAGLPQSPTRLRPDRHPEAAKKRRDWVLERMVELGMLGRTEADATARLPVRVQAHALPLRAPHFTTWALARTTPGTRLQTSLDPRLQRLAETSLLAHLEDLRVDGVRHGAVLIADTGSGKIRAFVGSPAFSSPDGGQVNGVTARRSPGSLLKPFIYGMAFEEGLITPETILNDAPSHYRDGYAPENFGEVFVGPVSARDALVRSLNLPALEVLEQVGVRRALRRLRDFGFTSLRKSADHYGLALGLGGVEVSLLELVTAYATLARGGEYRPLSFRDNDEDRAAGDDNERALGSLAAYEVAAVLEEAGWTSQERSAGVVLPRLSLKTGTSFGFRDAWTIAFTPEYTVGVWLGNFNGEASPALVGRRAAVPLALRIFRQMPLEGRWFRRPAGTPRRLLTSVGQRPSDAAERVTWLEPPDGATYSRHARQGGGTLRLRVTHAPQERVNFFVDDAFLGSCAVNEPLAWPLRSGTHRFTLVAGGYSESRTVRVE